MFLSAANIQALLVASAILIVLSIGQTFVIMTAGIDLSLAALVMLGAIVLGLTQCRRAAASALACLLAVAGDERGSASSTASASPPARSPTSW